VKPTKDSPSLPGPSQWTQKAPENSPVQKVRDMRDSKQIDDNELKSIFEFLQKEFPLDWLLRLEILELINGKLKVLSDQISQELDQLKSHSDEYSYLISNGLRLLGKDINSYFNQVAA